MAAARGEARLGGYPAAQGVWRFQIFCKFSKLFVKFFANFSLVLSSFSKDSFGTYISI